MFVVINPFMPKYACAWTHVHVLCAYADASARVRMFAAKMLRGKFTSFWLSKRTRDRVATNE